ncbi:WLM-domain-containing protein [Laetiporus sulphureus 93-53]|uniref:WLM-domain-containing protein n=1 Tax=Laetiporus sulphureus 93-53 TaxID=1314785 RepID=A0A165F7T7_9APHY|nr:WLM-domain-containing protein [Laetiporus sulphureus 93-53]KZT08562.1 WLM-domain-containing protein [Laetiporus sulphureus 93-53]
MSQTFVQSFTHLKDRPKAEQAATLLQRVASLVKPIMRKHGWVLPALAEFFPDSPNLMGLNINGGQKILLRLRPAYAPDTFLDEESIVHTMLHELTHNVHGPHDDKFYKFLAGLEEEYNALKRSGYAGEGFFSPGRRLGTNVSHNLPPHLARQKALEAAEKRRQLSKVLGSGGRLGAAGGRMPRINKSPRELAAEAAERRARDEKACASGAAAQKEAEKAAKESVEDAIIDLTQDPSPEPGVIFVGQPPSASGSSKAAVSSNRGKGKGQRVSASSSERPERVMASSASRSVPSPDTETWACPRCTLVNDPLTLQCAACELSRPENSQSASTNGWTCGVCGETRMPPEFWSCSFCGTITAHS